MARKEKYYQVGICPHCPDHVRQEFVDGINEYSYEILDQGKRYVYGDVHSLSFFRCDGCHSIVGYRTYYADAVDIDEAEKLEKTRIFQQDDSESESSFKDYSSLIYSTHQQAAGPPLSNYASEPVREEYEQALKVKQDPKSFAMRIRRALEAICLDKDAREEDLKKNLKKLLEGNEFRSIVAQIAEELVLIGNAGAHIKPRKPRNVEQVQVIDDFFRLVVNYVYEAPAKLKTYRELLTPELPEIESEETIN
ncbi:MAG TPA: DUF4145 domain-containing protein [Pyrinomonadaceae bacterium]|nr:DUF4145 domain-containing protein [Pyrinomonadaceae bacterium]